MDRLRDVCDRDNPDSNEQNPDIETPGGLDEEPVEKRPNVGATTPDGYPREDRADSDATGVE